MNPPLLLRACCLAGALALEPAAAGPEDGTARAGEGYLGVRATSVVRLDALESDGGGGLTVTEVVENSPAQQAGLQVGDEILSIDGAPLRATEQLESAIASRKPGTELELEVRRDAQRLRLRAATVPRVAPRPAPPVEKFEETRRLGVFIKTPPEGPGEVGVLPAGQGVQVVGFFPGSPLEDAGIEKGDLIWMLAGEPVYGGEDFVRRIRATLPDTELEMDVLRQGRRSKVTVTTTERTRSMQRFHIWGVVFYESNPRKQDSSFGLLLDIYKYTRHEEERTYRLFYFISWTTGDNEELRKVEP